MLPHFPALLSLFSVVDFTADFGPKYMMMMIFSSARNRPVLLMNLSVQQT